MPTPDPLDPTRRTPAELEAEIRQEEKRLHLMKTEGVDHFRERINKALPTMPE